MKTILSKLFVGMAIALTVVLVTSCDSKEKENQTLAAQAERINSELAAEVGNNPTLISDAGAEYADGQFQINITFADSLVVLADYTQSFVEYFLAEELKNNQTQDLADLINALSSIEGTYTLNLADVYGTDRDFEFTASQLKRLLNTSRAQLNYNEVKAQVVQLMSNAAAAVRAAEKAENVVFDLTSGFATYTVTFATDKNYANMSTANLKAYAIKKYKNEYAKFGTFTPMVVELFKSLGIDGYRIIYTNKANSKTLKTAVPWREIV
jgi:hypothetical protein